MSNSTDGAVAEGEHVRVRPWLIAILLTVSLSFVGLVFAAGRAMNRLDAIERSVDRIERKHDVDDERVNRHEVQIARLQISCAHACGLATEP